MEALIICLMALVVLGTGVLSLLALRTMAGTER
jgi:hypothetical protein